MIQLINKEKGKWHILIYGVECTFMSMSLYVGNNLFPEKPNSDRGLRWRICRKWVSYNQIKITIKPK